MSKVVSFLLILWSILPLEAYSCRDCSGVLNGLGLENVLPDGFGERSGRVSLNGVISQLGERDVFELKTSDAFQLTIKRNTNSIQVRLLNQKECQIVVLDDTTGGNSGQIKLDVGAGNFFLLISGLRGFQGAYNIEVDLSQPTSAPLADVVDPTLMEYLTCNYDLDLDGLFSEFEARMVSEINLPNRGVQTLSGLEAFKNLERLNVPGNRITSLVPLKDLINLEMVDASHNNVSSIPIFGLRNRIETLLLNNNGAINDMSPLVEMDELKEVNLDENRLTSIPNLSNLRRLRRLSLNVNRINHIAGLNGLMLEELFLSENEIIDLSPIRGMNSLIKFSANGNKVESLEPVSDLKALEDLDLRDNNISRIVPLQGLVNLRLLNLRGNNLSDISALSQLVNLSLLDLSRLIDTGGVVDVAPLSGLTKLKNLNLEGNQIENILALSGLREMVRLNINNNNVADLDHVSFGVALEELLMENNNLTSISTLSSATGLRELHLSNNDIRFIDSTERMKNLEVLRLDNNEVESLSPLSDLENLRLLTLCNNNINDISPLAKMTYIEKLDLGENQILEIEALRSMENLQELGLSNNQIERIDSIEGLLGIRSATFLNNKISDLSALRNLPELRSLELGGNHIEDLSPLLGGILFEFGGDFLNLEGNDLEKDDCPNIRALQNLGFGEIRYNRQRGGNLNNCNDCVDTNTRWIPHLTPKSSSVRSSLVVTNLSPLDQSLEFRLYGDSDGCFRIETLSVPAEGYLEEDLYSLFPGDDISHLSISGSENCPVMVGYKAGGGDTSYILESSQINKEFSFYGSDAKLANAVAIVNLGNSNAVIRAFIVDSSGERVNEGLVLHPSLFPYSEKCLYALDSLSPTDPRQRILIEANQPIAVSFFRFNEGRGLITFQGINSILPFDLSVEDAPTRWIPYLTTRSDNLKTYIVATSFSEEVQQIRFRPFTDNGVELNVVIDSINPRETKLWSGSLELEGVSISHILIEAARNVAVSAGYRLGESLGQSYAREVAAFGKRVVLYQGDGRVTEDKVALVNLGLEPAKIGLIKYDTNQYEVEREEINSALPRLVKQQFTPDSYFAAGPPGQIVIESTELIAVTTFRREPNGSSTPQYHHVNPIISEIGIPPLVNPSGPDDHSNTFVGATRLNPNRIVDGVLESPGDLDYFRVNIPEASIQGDNKILILYSTGETMLLGSLYNESAEPINANAAYEDSNNFILEYRNLKKGDYYLEVKGRNSETGSYRVGRR